MGREVETRSYYGADGKLRAYQKYDVRRNDGGWKMAGVWEEYRYDPLGRRIMVRTRGDGGMCNVGAWECTSSITRFVWAGDQLLWELKAESVLHEVKHILQFAGKTPAQATAIIQRDGQQMYDDEAEAWARANVCTKMQDGSCQ